MKIWIGAQAPFVTLFLEIEPGHEYEEEVAMIIEEIIKQRHLGIKNEVGVYVTPSFPKLVYVLDENNIHATSKYRYHCSIEEQFSTTARLVDIYGTFIVSLPNPGKCSRASRLFCLLFLS